MALSQISKLNKRLHIENNHFSSLWWKQLQYFNEWVGLLSIKNDSKFSVIIHFKTLYTRLEKSKLKLHQKGNLLHINRRLKPALDWLVCVHGGDVTNKLDTLRSQTDS